MRGAPTFRGCTPSRCGALCPCAPREDPLANGREDTNDSRQGGQAKRAAARSAQKSGGPAAGGDDRLRLGIRTGRGGTGPKRGLSFQISPLLPLSKSDVKANLQGYFIIGTPEQRSRENQANTLFFLGGRSSPSGSRCSGRAPHVTTVQSMGCSTFAPQIRPCASGANDASGAEAAFFFTADLSVAAGSPPPRRASHAAGQNGIMESGRCRPPRCGWGCRPCRCRPGRRCCRFGSR